MIKIQFYKNDLPKQRNIKENELHEQIYKASEKGDFEITINNKRSLAQNNALHLYYSLLSDEFNNQGLDFEKIFKNPVAIIITPEIIKECMWKPLQKAMFGTKSTTKLSKQKQIDMIYDVLNKKLSESFGIHIPFPNKEDLR